MKNYMKDYVRKDYWAISEYKLSSQKEKVAFVTFAILIVMFIGGIFLI
jgi:hypothetical protein